MVVKILFLLMWFCILFLSPPLCVFITFAMAPAVVSSMVDIRPGKNTAYTVGLFNFAGLVIPCSRFIKVGLPSNFGEAMSLQGLMVVYLFAGMGYFIVWLVPKITVIIVDYRSERRAITIREKMAKLIEEWGPEVKKN